MKNIETILKEAGVELTDEQKTAIVDGVKENYKTIADYTKQSDKVESLQKTLEETQTALKAFDGVNPEELKKQIEDLNKAINDKDTEYQEKIAQRDFDDLLKTAIVEAKGKNAKAITALLDIEALKSSKNQKDDMAKAIKELTEAEDSKMLFGEPEPEKKGTGSPIGTIKKDGAPAEVNMHSALAEHYK